MSSKTPATVSLFVPKVMVLDFPFLWTDEEAMWKILDGPLGQELLQSLEQKGLKGVDIWSSGFKSFTSGKKPITLDGLLNNALPNFNGSPVAGLTWLDDQHFLQAGEIDRGLDGDRLVRGAAFLD